MGKAENWVEDYLKARVEQEGGLCWKISAAHVKGIPDRLVILRRTVLVETKAPKKTLEPIQVHRRYEILRSGGEHYMVDSHAAVEALIANLLQTELQKDIINEQDADYSIHHHTLPSLRLGETNTH